MPNNSELQTFDLFGPENDPIKVSEATLASLRQEFHVLEVSTLMPGMQGTGVKLAGLLDLLQVPPDADHVTFTSKDGQYSASLNIDQARDFGILVYQVDGQPLPLNNGGPFRLITPGLGDLCANVKNIGQIKVSTGLGKDTRPEERSC